MDNIETALNLHEQSQSALAQGNLSEAERLCVASLEIFQRVDGENCPDAANLLNALAQIREQRGDYDGALQACRQSLAILDLIRETFTGENASAVRLQALSHIGNIQRHRAQYPEAESTLQGA